MNVRNSYTHKRINIIKFVFVSRNDNSARDFRFGRQRFALQPPMPPRTLCLLLTRLSDRSLPPCTVSSVGISRRIVFALALVLRGSPAVGLVRKGLRVDRTDFSKAYRNLICQAAVLLWPARLPAGFYVIKS